MEWFVFAWAVLTALGLFSALGNLAKNRYPRTVKREVDVAGVVFGILLLLVLTVALVAYTL